MKEIANRMGGHMEEVFMCFNVLLATFRTKLSFYNSAAVQAIVFCAIFLVTHGVGRFSKVGKVLNGLLRFCWLLILVKNMLAYELVYLGELPVAFEKLKVMVQYLNITS